MWIAYKSSSRKFRNLKKRKSKKKEQFIIIWKCSRRKGKTILKRRKDILKEHFALEENFYHRGNLVKTCHFPVQISSKTKEEKEKRRRRERSRLMKHCASYKEKEKYKETKYRRRYCSIVLYVLYYHHVLSCFNRVETFLRN